MKQDSLFWAICNLEDDLILEAEEGTMMEKKHGKKAVRIALIAAAAAALLAGTVVAAKLYTRSADRMEKSWNQAAQQPMTTEQKDFIDEKSADIGETAEDQGITITAQSVTCTDDTAYISVVMNADKEQYSMPYAEMFPADVAATVENPNWAQPLVCDHIGITGNVVQDDGSTELEWRIEVSELPEGQRLNDGASVVTVDVKQVVFHNMAENNPQEQIVEGSWKLAVTLPESDETPPVEAQQSAEFTGDLNFTVEGIQVTADSLQFRLVAPSNDYVILGTDQLELAKAAEPDAPFYSVEALLKDGTCVPTTGASMSLNEESGMDEWSIQWVTPIDPETVVALIFSDGTSRQEIPMES